MVRNRKMTWPIQADEIKEVYGKDTAARLDLLGVEKYQPILEEVRREGAENFEDWCLTIMPREIYDDFVAPYTEKQWGMPATELSAEFAPKRVQVRHDGDKRLFKDKFQGFPSAEFVDGNYAALHDKLWGPQWRRKITLGHKMTLTRTLGLLSKGVKPDVIFVTVPLDDFCESILGELPWRGLNFEHTFLQQKEFAQDAMVVNWPGKDWPFIRTHETKHASGQRIDATVLTTEFTGALTRFYPVPGRDRAGLDLNERYKAYIGYMLGKFSPIKFCGRLASYAYMDMDDVIRQALDVTREVIW
jgi:UDP-galactopyranose mutase